MAVIVTVFIVMRVRVFKVGIMPVCESVIVTICELVVVAIYESQMMIFRVDVNSTVCIAVIVTVFVIVKG